MKILFNGDARDVAAKTLNEALDELGYADTVVATAVNEGFVPAGARASRQLSEGDRIEVLAPMQGG